MQIADIITEYGQYYQDRGQNIASLYQVARRTSVTEGIFTPVMTDDTIWQAGKVTFDRITQPFQKLFTPAGTVQLKPVEIRMHHLKADTQEWPDDLEASWLGFLSSANLSRTEWPFIRWYLETQYFAQIQEDQEMYEIARGVATAPTPGVAGVAGTGMNGCLTIMAANIAAGRQVPITMGAIPTSDVAFVDYVEDFGDQIDKKYWNRPMMLHMSEDLVRKYQRGELEKYGKYTTQNAAGLKLRFTNLTLKDLPSHNGSSRIWTTPKENAIILKKKTQNQKLVDVQGFERLVKFMTDWWMGVGFILPEIVWSNDQA